MLVTILCSAMILMAIFLVVAVLMQSGKENRLSGTIAGGADTFYGKTKGKSLDRVLSKATTIVAIIFVVLVFLVYVIQRGEAKKELDTGDTGTQTPSVEDIAGEEEDEEPTAEGGEEQKPTEGTKEENTTGTGEEEPKATTDGGAEGDHTPETPAE